MRQVFNQLRTPNHSQGRLRRSRLVQAGAALTTAAAIFAGCGQSGGQTNTDKLSTPNAPAKTNPGPNNATGGQAQTTTGTEQVKPIESVCDVQELMAAAQQFFGYSAVQCKSYANVKPGYIAVLLQRKGDPNTVLMQGAAEVAVDANQITFNSWSNNPAIAAAVQAVRAPDVNGNPALWGIGGSLVTTYGSQEVDINLSYIPGRSESQGEQFAVQAATILEDSAGH